MKEHSAEIEVTLRHILARLKPDASLIFEIRTTRDIAENRQWLSYTRLNSDLLEYLLELVCTDIRARKRFRQRDCLLTFKRILKSWPVAESLTNEAVDKLFFLYQNYIFSPNEDLQWAVSVMLKDRELRDEQIQWLIDHFEESSHILNRLLQYPTQNPLIQDWARKTLAIPQSLNERRSELLGLLINISIPHEAKQEDPVVKAWAIYHSKVDLVEKTKLLIAILDDSNLMEVAEIAERIQCPEVIEFALERIAGSEV